MSFSKACRPGYHFLAEIDLRACNAKDEDIPVDPILWLQLDAIGRHGAVRLDVHDHGLHAEGTVIQRLEH